MRGFQIPSVILIVPTVEDVLLYLIFLILRGDIFLFSYMLVPGILVLP